MKCQSEMVVRGGQKIPCGKCVICLQNKQSVWTFRIMNECDVAETARFVTLTYDEKYLPYRNDNGVNGTLWDKESKLWGGDYSRLVNSLELRDVQLFLKKCRSKVMNEANNAFKSDREGRENEMIRYVKKSEISGKWSCKMRYFGCGEYGEHGTERSHWHILMWNLPREWYKWDPIHEEEYSTVLEEIWGKGFVSIGQVNRHRCAYVAGYMMKQVGHWWDEEKEIRQKPMQFMSKNPGIGANWINDENRNYITRTKNNYVGCEGGYKQPIGTYYKKKIYGDEKEKWEYEYEAEEGRTVTGETPGVRLRSKEETMAIRKGRKAERKQERAIEERVQSEEYGDIIGSDQRIRREAEEAVRIKGNLLMNKKGKL